MYGAIPVLVWVQTLVVVIGDAMSEYDFSKYHPAVNLVFFMGAFGLSVMLLHPVYLLSGLLFSTTYYLLLNGRKGWITIRKMLVLLLFLTIINPLLNTRGNTILFKVMGRPYTYEALIYGVSVATIFVVMLLWLGCYNKILTGDKFICLFGNIMPTVSLLLVMIFRMMPNFICKIKQITGARNAIGKGTENGNAKEKIKCGVTVLGVLASWALEDGVVTGDSMKARGYGTCKRSGFIVYKMRKSDWTMLVIMLCLLGTVFGFAINGGMASSFIPVIELAPISGINILGFVAYCVFLMLPTVVHVKETILWNISKYKI